MGTLTIINTILIWVILMLLLVKPYLEKFTITIDRTFWEKKPYGFHITKWKYSKGVTPNSGVNILSFNWRNPDNMKDDFRNVRKNKPIN